MPFGKKRKALLASIAAAVLELNPDRGEHWTVDGKPAMDAVETLIGDASITREDVEEASPEASREWVRLQQAADADAPPADDQAGGASGVASGARLADAPPADDQAGGVSDQILLYGETMRSEKSEPMKPVALARGYASDEAGLAASDFMNSSPDLAPEGKRGWAYHLRPTDEADDVEALPIIVKGEQAETADTAPAADGGE